MNIYTYYHLMKSLRSLAADFIGKKDKSKIVKICENVLDGKELNKQDNIIMLCFSREQPTHPFIYNTLYDRAVDHIEKIIAWLEGGCTPQDRQTIYFLFKMLGDSMYVSSQMKLFEAFFDDTPPTLTTLLVKQKIRDIKRARKLDYIEAHTDFDGCCELVKQIYLMKHSEQDITRMCGKGVCIDTYIIIRQLLRGVCLGVVERCRNSTIDMNHMGPILERYGIIRLAD